MAVTQVEGQVHICQNPDCGREFSEPAITRVSGTQHPKCIFCGANTKKLYSKPILTVFGKSMPSNWE
jgi:hypothetical protein